jgi:Ser/Thr protein kinase RdoA (MazF antagonist)
MPDHHVEAVQGGLVGELVHVIEDHDDLLGEGLGRLHQAQRELAR